MTSIQTLRENPTLSGILVTLSAALIFGAHSPAERGFYAEGGSLALVAIVTTWARALPLALYCLATRKKLFQSREDIKQAVIGGAFQSLSALCVFAALLYLSAPVVIIILFTHTLMLLLFMAWRKEVVLDKVTVATTLAALAGLSFVVDLWHPQPMTSWIGVGFAFLSGLSTVSRMYVYGHQTKARPPAVVGAENFLMAAPLISVAAFFMPLHAPASATGFGWLAIASASLAAGSFLMFYGISLLGSFRYSLFCKTEPVFTSLFSVWFVGEILKPQQYLGIALVVGSLALYQIYQQKRI